MGADIVSERNKSYRRAAIMGGLLLLLVLSALIVLLFVLVPVKVLAWVGLCLLATVVILLVASSMIPINIEKIISEQAENVIDYQDKRLLELALDERLSQDDLYDFAKDWDIETAPIKSVLLMAYLMKTRPELRFPPAIVPRLNGVLSFCRFQNIKREAHFTKLGEALRKEGIPFAILKGGAMKVYRPDFPRWMNDIDMLVPADKYEKAVDVAISLGYDKPMATDHSVDLHLPGSDEGLIDIHKHLEMFTGNEDSLNEGLFARAELTDIFSTKGYLPSPEDMVFVALVNLYKNLAENQTQESSLTSFYDIKYLLDSKAEFDISVVKENARLTGGEFQVLFSSKLIDSVVPGLLPVGFVESLKVSDKGFKKQLIDFLFRRDVLSNARDAMKETRIGGTLQRDWNLLVFVWVNIVSILKDLFNNIALKKALLAFHYYVKS